MSEQFDYLSASELRRLVLSRQVSPVELTERALQKAQATDASLNAFVTLAPEQAMHAARQAEAQVQSGGAVGLLHGIPISIKDLISVEGMRYTFGSRVAAENMGLVDSPAVARLRAAGAIIIGKTTTSEYGCTAGALSPLTGATRHPWDLSKSPGGSSAGAAASVAAGITPFALGTDGGGSIRTPAALTGLVGFKPTFGRVPVWPMPAMLGLAHHCPIARTVQDVALLLTSIAGYDARDPFSLSAPVPDFLSACAASVAGLRIAFSPTLGFATPDPEVLALSAAAVGRFEQLGCFVEQVDDVFDEDPAPQWTAEFNAGVIMRLRPLFEAHGDQLDPSVARLLENAFSQTMQDFCARQAERHGLRERMRTFFERFDLLVSPALPVSCLDVTRESPPHLAASGPLAWTQYPYAFNLTGQPAAVVCGGIAADGMPVGIQIVGRLHGDADVLRAAAAFERTWPPGYNVRAVAS